ncbi:MAG: helix-turn-helix transcriptional regulator [Acutalibacter sp.]
MKKLHGEMLREALCQNLKKFRKEAHFSQEQIARQLGVNRATYTYYETGKTTPSVEDLYLLSQLYGRAMEEFFQ